MKKITPILLIVLALCAALPLCRMAAQAAPQNGRIIVYYFYNDYRCESCKKIEAYTSETVHGKFADELKNKTMAWQTVNVDQADNKHFVKDFKIYTKQVVVAEVQNGEVKRWKNLDKIWTLLNNKDKFQAYIESEVKAFRGGQ